MVSVLDLKLVLFCLSYDWMGKIPTVSISEVLFPSELFLKRERFKTDETCHIKLMKLYTDYVTVS